LRAERIQQLKLSALLWGGTPGRLIESAEDGLVELASSAPLLAELQGVLSRAKFARQLAARGLTVGDVFDGYAALVLVVTPATIAPTVARDLGEIRVADADGTRCPMDKWGSFSSAE
jgi:hypothetical protein